ncbi:MAG: 5-(carboxyamino)imidazole ribonucleotide synthase [Elusimicrobiota bacterium]
MTKPILPGARVGVLGGGQLGRMFALAARRMGYRVHTLSPETDTPAGQVADVEVTAAYDDLDAVRNFARGVDAVTFEFENVPAAAAQEAARHAPVRPAGSVLHVAQHRLREKTFLSEAGFPVTPFRAVRSKEDLLAGLKALGTPCVLKTAGFGYDGKGQTKIQSAAEADAAFAALAGAEGILEAFVPFEKEMSVVAARGADGSFAAYAPIENAHRRHILDVSVMPASISPRLAKEAVDVARALFDKLELVGLTCIEFFVTGKEGLLINELAPRPHNSGHLTLDACDAGQFEQQLRAVCGLPLGSTAAAAPAAMANLLGDLWESGEPDWGRALTVPGARLHLYGKADARPGRKMGHITALAPTAEEARRRVLAARDALSSPKK